MSHRHLVIAVMTIALAAPAVPAAAQSQPGRDFAREITREVTREVHELVRAITSQTDRLRDIDRERGPEQSERLAQTFKVGKTGTLDLSVMSGSVTITGGAGDDIRIEATKRVRAKTPDEAKGQLSGITVAMSERAGRVEVRTDYAERRSRGSVDFTIRMPADGSVLVKSFSGNIKVSGVRGEVRLENVSGDIVVTGAGPKLSVRTMSGDVQVSDVTGDGDVTLSVISGTVTGQRIKARSLDAGGVSGAVRLTDVTADRVVLHTMSGDLEYTGPLAKGGRYELRTHSGDITLVPTAVTGFEVEASTFNGTFKSDFPVTLRSVGGKSTGQAAPPKPPQPPLPPLPDRPGERRRPDLRVPSPPAVPSVPGRTVLGTYGDGSTVLVLSSFSGDITIVKK